MSHFRNPQNMGVMKDADGIGRVGNPTCGDVMHLYIKVEDNFINSISFETFGCASAIATSSMITELAKNKTLEEAEKISFQQLASELGGLPVIKMHCSSLAVEALRAAIKDFREKQAKQSA